MSEASSLNVDNLLAHERQLRNLAAGLVASFDRRVDLVQDSYLALLENEGARPRHLSGYLGRVLRNTLARQGSRESRRRELEQTRASQATQADTLSIVERLELRREIVDAVLELPEAQRQVVFLRFFEDLMPQKIAEQLGEPLATVKSRLARALDALRHRLAEQKGDAQRLRSSLLGLALLGPREEGAGLLAKFAVETKLVAALVVVGLSVFAYQSIQHDAEPERPAVVVATEETTRSPERADVVSREVSESEDLAKTDTDTAGHVVPLATQDENRRPEAAPEPAPGMVLVVDGEGRPRAGVAVVLEARLLDQIRRPFRALSDSEGLVDVRPALAQLVSSGTAEMLGIGFGFPSIDGAGLQLERDVDFAGARLELPPTAPLEIRVLDESGVPHEGRIELEILGKPRGAEGKSAGHFVTPYTAEFAGGVHRVPHLGLGLDLDIELRTVEGKRPLLRESLEGPRTTSELMQIDLRLERAFPELRGRVVDHRGQVQASRRFDVALFLPRELPTAVMERRKSLGLDETNTEFGRRIELESIETDAEGRFRMPFRFDREAVPSRALVLAAEVDKRGESAGPSAVLELEAEMSDAKLLLGDLVLKEAVSLASGRVVDDRGEPIAGVLIEARELKEGSARKSILGPRLNLGSRLGWCRSDEEGRFQVSGTPADSFALTASGEGLERTTGDPLQVGASTVELSCARRGTLEGRIVVKDLGEVWNLSITCRSKMKGVETGGFLPSSGLPGTALNGAIRADGSFRMEDLRPGLQTVEIRSAGKLLASYEDIEVGPGEVAAPAALERIRVEGLEPLPRVQLVDENGRPLAHRRARLQKVHVGRFSTQTSSMQANLDGQGSFWMTAPEGYRDGGPVVVTGFKPAVLTIGGPFTRLQLESGPRLHIKLVLSSALQAANIEAELRMLPSRTSNSVLMPRSGLTERKQVVDGKLDFQLSEGGRYALKLRNLGAESGQEIELEGDGIFEVPEGRERLDLELKSVLP